MWSAGCVDLYLVVDSWDFSFPRPGVAPVSTAGYDPAMIIETSAQLHDWVCRNAAGQAAGLDAAAAAHAMDCVQSVIWRHARGQGLRLGDDWGWVLELYGPDQFREIVAAAAESAAADRSRRRRRGY